MDDTSRHGESFQILVVEDSPEDARMTLRALSKLDPRPNVKVVADGEEALKFWFEPGACRPELVFLDLKLPKVHGLEVLRRIKLEANIRQIPVVVLTSSDQPSDVSAAKSLGAAEYIRKPMDPKVYIQVICESAAKYLKSCTCAL